GAQTNYEEGQETLNRRHRAEEQQTRCPSIQMRVLQHFNSLVSNDTFPLNFFRLENGFRISL
ncbi:MAG: hypothetical protein ABGZ08_07180, partial [Akkermansiaceae bacterium]